MSKDDVIAFCKERGVTGEKVGLIHSALDDKWAMEWVELLCLSGYSYEQTLQAFLGFKRGVLLENVKFFYRKEFNYLQMDEARVAFQEGIAFEKIEFFTIKSFILCRCMKQVWLFRKDFP